MLDELAPGRCAADRRSRCVLACLVVFAAWLLIPAVGEAQGCALCRSTVAGQSDRVTESLNAGILILLVPPVSIMLAILAMAFRRERQGVRPLRRPSVQAVAMEPGVTGVTGVTDLPNA